MRKILIIIFSVIVATVSAQIRVPATIIQNSDEDTYPIALTEDLLGTAKQVTRYTQLDSIPTDVMEIGMLATVADSSFALYYLTSTDPVTWLPYTYGNPVLEYVTAEDTTKWGLGGDSDLTYDGSRTVTNEDIAAYGNVIGGETVIDFLDNYYFPDELPKASLSTSGTNILEFGLTGGGLSRALAWTATKGTHDIATINVAGFDITASGETQSSTQSVVLSPDVTNTFLMTVTDTEDNSANNTASFYFRNGYYWGSQADVTTVTDANILALDGASSGSGKELATSRIKEFNGINGAGEYLVFAFPSSWGTPVFVINGLTSTAWTKIRSDSFENINGYSETYQVWVSNTQYNGAVSKFKID